MCHGKCGCGCMKVGKYLLIVGGLNWGLVGLGMLLGKDLNVLNMILGSVPVVEAVVYILVGVAAVMKLFGCPMHRGMAGCTCEAGSMDKKM